MTYQVWNHETMKTGEKTPTSYTPTRHEAKARFITGSTPIIQNRDNCTPAEAKITAETEWENWLKWHRDLWNRCHD